MTSRAAAIRYARALFDVASKEADVQQVGRDLDAFARLVAGNAQLERVFVNPAIPAPRKRALVKELLSKGGAVAAPVAKLLEMLAERDRLALLPELATAYRERLMEHARIVRAEVVTAVDLPADRVAALRQGLAAATGRQVQLENRVDPSIIGGAITRIGSTVYDGSVTRQLERMKEALTQKA